MRSIDEAIKNLSGIPVQLPLSSGIAEVRILRGIFSDLHADMSCVTISDLRKIDASNFAKVKSILRKKSHSLAGMELSSMQFTFDHVVGLLNSSHREIGPLAKELAASQSALDNGI